MTVDKLKMHSPDLTQRNIDAIAALFPTVVTETLDADGSPVRAVDFDALRQELSDHIVEGPQERYQLDWPGKRAASFAANAPIAKTLRPVREESVNFDTTRNLFIEGDNLEVLKLLQESYLGKVKLIYIDPPYNTGNDFVYDDDFAESSREYLERSGQKSDAGDRLVANQESNGRFHSDWLSMMYPRLRLARNLLAPDGLIFISIDDSEASALVQIAGEVFGRSNVVATIAWEKRYTRSNNANSFYSVKDSLVLCRRSETASPIKELRNDESAGIYSNPDDDPRGPWTSSSYVNPATKQARPNLAYSIHRPADGATIDHPTHAWKFQTSEYQRHVAEGRLWWGKEGLAQYPRLKVFLGEMSDGMVPIDLWSHETAGTTDEGGAEVKALFGAAVFDFPKPTKLIRKLLGVFVPPSSTWSKDLTVLDFFAGSSSTAHAVLAQNAADGGDRRFIMVQLAEPTAAKSIARRQGFEDIAQLSRERIRRAATTIAVESAQELPTREKPLDLGFRSLRLDTTNLTNVLSTPEDLLQLALSATVDSVKTDRTEEDLLFQVLLDWGLELSLPIAREDLDGHEVLTVDDDALIACFTNNVTDSVVHAIARRHPLRAVFKDSGFTNDAARINAEQVFRELSPETEVRAI